MGLLPFATLPFKIGFTPTFLDLVLLALYFVWIMRLATRRQGRPTHGLPHRFLEALGSLPPCAGNALGLDRLVMLLCDASEIDAVVAFTPEDL